MNSQRANSTGTFAPPYDTTPVWESISVKGVYAKMAEWMNSLEKAAPRADLKQTPARLWRSV